MLLTAEDGGIVNDPVLLRLEENRFWLAAADSDVLLWAKGVALNSGMDVEIRELDVAPMQIQGPKSRELVQDLFGERVRSSRYYQFFETKLGDIPVIVTRTGWTGELGYELYLLDPARGDAVVGARHGSRQAATASRRPARRTSAASKPASSTTAST